ncbi:MAG TPA: type II secretion system F family protein [Dehalococcoidia bacterium]|nr:type II secretion system F family protein [Dehalococcoidia bacterium]
MLEAITVMMVFASVFLVVIGLRGHTFDPVEERLRAVHANMRARNPALAQPFVQRAAGPVTGAIVQFIARFLPQTWIREADERLERAGNPITLPGYILLWSLIAFGFALIGALFGNSAGPVGIPVGFFLGLAAGVYLPRLWLRARVSQRAFLTRKGLPDALDLMTTSVEAGLSLDSALVRVAEFQRGPFQDELIRAMQNVTLGKSRREALDELDERLGVSEVSTFVQAVHQAEITGTPIGHVLRVQAEQVRIKRRQAAEAQAQRVPVMMVIPLVLFIFPSLFVVLLGPAAITIVDLLGNDQFR